jgi:hypothetical protein
MIISVVNHSNSVVSDAELQTVIRAINRQIQEDFAPNWGMSAMLRLEGRSSTEPDKVQVPDMRGDAILYLWDRSDVPDALGYHFANNRGIPYGFVFLDVAKRVGENWTVTLSHEALELIADPECNLLVMGPHPSEDRVVFHWFEMCDAVQGETYRLDGIEVSNFVLPLYFTGTRDVDEVGARNDFLGTVGADGQTLRSFAINPGGYVGFFDPTINDHDTFMVAGASESATAARLALKAKIVETRRAARSRKSNARAALRAAPTAAATAAARIGVGPQVLATRAAAPVGRRYVSVKAATAVSPTGSSEGPQPHDGQ